MPRRGGIAEGIAEGTTERAKHASLLAFLVSK